MALPASLVWEVDTATGSDNNGGGFDPDVTSPGTDYTQGAGQTTYAMTDIKTDGATTTVMVSATHNFVAADVGNTVQITATDAGSHATVGFYNIRSVAANKATVDRAWATADNSDHPGASGTLGGALATPQKACSNMVGGNTMYIKAGTYTTSAAAMSPPAGSAGNATEIVGYTSTRTDGGRATLQTSSGSNNLITVTNNYVVLRNLELDGADLADTCLRSQGQYDYYVNIKAHRFVTYGLRVDSVDPTFIDIEVTDGKAASTNAILLIGASSNGRYTRIYVHDTPCVGIRGYKTYAVFNRVIVANCTGDGFYFDTNYGGALINCVSYGNSSDGLALDGASGADNIHVENCVFAHNGGYGINAITTNWSAINRGSGRNYFANNTSGAYTSNWPAGVGDVLSSSTDIADPFVNADAHDYGLNGNALGGLLCVGVAAPGTIPGTVAAGYLDIGSVQHGGMPRFGDRTGGLR